ncbi:MAG: hypothetical protein RL653_4299 [Pseudomonadota bacterium]|jgi:hypothetical protein
MGLTIQNVQSVTAVTSAARPDSQGVSGTFPVETVDLSSGARLVGRLTQLVKSDPDAFKHVTRDVANRLNDAANHATGQEASRLRLLAEAVSKAAQAQAQAAEEVQPVEVGNAVMGIAGPAEAAPVRPSEPRGPDPAAVDALVKSALAGKI